MDKFRPVELYEEDIKLIMHTDYSCKQYSLFRLEKKKLAHFFFHVASQLTTLPWPSLQSQIKMR